MANKVVVGLQWGDEGKGKIIDLLAKDADCIVRYQGGNNAGHTVVVDDHEYIFHLIPSGILYPRKICVIGNGVVVDPEAFLKELEFLRSRSIAVKGRLYISEHAHVIFPYHRILDSLRESKRASRIGTTGRGIGPCYADKFSRCGIRIGDLLNRRVLREKLTDNIREKNEVFRKVYRHSGFRLDDLFRDYCRFADALAPFVARTEELINTAIARKKRVLFEGAQGTFLDIDFGTYPFVTSSSTTSGGACTGAGVAPVHIDSVIGVLKAYTTRVGEGPFPTEFEQPLMDTIRSIGKEFGATTGRPRRCGWFDAVMARFAVMLNGVSSVAVMKLDVLDTLPAIKVCVGYRYKGTMLKNFPADGEILRSLRPVYREFPGWQQPTTAATRFTDLPLNARRYLQAIEKMIDTKIAYISVGSQRNQTIAR